MKNNKSFSGKAIYKPKGKAGEYSEWACNFYNGCSNGCEYCYCKKGILAKTMGGDVPTLKKSFKNEAHALEIFEKELLQNKEELQKHSLFFSFSTDPMLPETIDLTIKAIAVAVKHGVKVKILTKMADFTDRFILKGAFHACTLENFQKIGFLGEIAFGFTLTGHDELEPGASTNQQRIEAMKRLHDAGFKTFASIEPIVNFENSLRMIEQTIGYCDLYKIGLMSGRTYSVLDTKAFFESACDLGSIKHLRLYFKDSFLKSIDVDRILLPKYCVDRDYNLFNNKI